MTTPSQHPTVPAKAPVDPAPVEALLIRLARDAAAAVIIEPMVKLRREGRDTLVLCSVAVHVGDDAPVNLHLQQMLLLIDCLTVEPAFTPPADLAERLSAAVLDAARSAETIARSIH